MNIKFPEGTHVCEDAFSYKTLCLDISLPVPPDGVPKYDEDDEPWDEDDDEDAEDWDQDERPGLTLEIDMDDVNPREAQYTLQRLVDDLSACGWEILSVFGKG